MEKITHMPEDSVSEGEAGESGTRREFLSTLTKSAAALVAATLPACGYTKAQLDMMTDDAELNTVLAGSGLLVVPHHAVGGSWPSQVMIVASNSVCARVYRQEDDSYLVYYRCDDKGEKQEGDPGKEVNTVGMAKVFQTAAEAGKFLIETFDKPEAVVEKE